MVGSLSIAEQYQELFRVRRSLAPTLSQKMFVWSLLILKLNSWVMLAETDLGIPQIVKYAFAAYFLFSMFYIMYQRPLTLKYYGMMGLVVFLFCVYSLWLVGKSVKFEARYFQFFFAAKYYAIPFFFPVFMFFIKFDLKFVKYLFNFSLKFLPLLFICLISVIVTLNADKWEEHLHRIHIFNFALSLVLLNLHYFSGRKWTRNLLIGFFIGAMFVGAYYGRRGYVFDIIFMFFFYYVLMTGNRVVSASNKIRSFFLVGLALFLFTLMLGTLKSNLYIFERGLDSAAWEESRGSVFKEFFADFGSRPGDWLWGRGLDGRVLRTMDVESGGYGDTIENGFLYIFLKAGGIYLILMMVIFLRAAYLGWFKSRNQFAKSTSAIIIMHIIGMMSFNLPVLGADYVLVWICVVLCYSSEIRKLDDKQVKLLLNL